MRDADLMAYVVGAMDPGRRRDMRRRLDRDAALQTRADELSSELGTVPDPPVAAWRLPLPGARGPAGGGLSSRPARFMGRLRPGRRFVTHISSVREPAQRRLVVLYQRAGDWEIVYPQHPEDTLRLSQLPEDKEGWRLELTAMEEPGEQRWAVVLPKLERAIDWGAPQHVRWRGLMEAVYTGEVPVCSTRIEVAPVE